MPWRFGRLEAAQVALVVHDMSGSECPRVLTAPHAYLRLHGPERYGGRYPAATLARWATWLTELSARGMDAFVYFNNDRDAHAPFDAERLRDAIARRA